ncbi:MULTISPECIES: hypothetical protein [Bacillus]|uniref:Zn-dependent protease with chaperone function n=2 Tax=Bacillus TaxID=1386 RepID=A0ABS4CW75_9BACI|nr:MULTISPECIES: hypothetical protein [Bacillus]MBP1081845.1 Zn-dependent protease with chaperone function [Bacillus capparidis]MED1096494.1 hypothetical protein [Bacillus capparidis]
MEVRADHLGSSFLPGGTQQMAESLSCIALRQDEAIAKSMEYSIAVNEKKKSSSNSLEREEWWLFRILEFQFMPHPPMYWRVQALKRNHTGWSKKIVRRWMIDRMKESWIR